MILCVSVERVGDRALIRLPVGAERESGLGSGSDMEDECWARYMLSII